MALVPVSEPLLYHVNVDHVNPWVWVLCCRTQMVLVIILIGADIVDDGLEALLAEWTLWLYLQDQCSKLQALQSFHNAVSTTEG
jgi:hypothetical protein